MIVNGLPRRPCEADTAPSTDTNRAAQLYQSALEYVGTSIFLVGRGQLPDLERGDRLVDTLLDSMGSGPQLLLAATDRTQNYQVAAHCANVSILAMRMATVLDCEQDMIRRVGLAGLLHELGVVRLPERLLHQTSSLDRGEKRVLRQRPVHSAEVLGQLPPEYQYLLQIVAQVHEREDGTGFPFGLSGGRIREEAQLLGIADTLEACLHPRPYRSPKTGYQAVTELTSGGNNSFSRRVMKSLLQAFSLYPYNEYLLLNNGFIGQVIDINQGNPLRPKIRLLFQDGTPLEEERLVDLETDTSLHVVKAITRPELKELTIGR